MRTVNVVLPYIRHTPSQWFSGRIQPKCSSVSISANSSEESQPRICSGVRSTQRFLPTWTSKGHLRRPQRGSEL